MNTTFNRVELLKKLMLAKPAVSTQTYIPLLTHFLFDGKSVTAYNDVSAISVVCDGGLYGCLPSELMIKTLSSLSADSISLVKFEDHVLISSGKSKIKLPALPNTDYPFSFGNITAKPLNNFKVDRGMLKGLQKCLIGVGTDQAHPAQMGVTLDPYYSETEAAFYSTDNVTISRFVFDTDSDQHDPIIMPTFFCNQLLSLAQNNEDIKIEIYRDSLIAKFGDGSRLFTKIIADLEPMSFEDVIEKYVGRGQLETTVIPDLFDQSFERAILVQVSELIKDTTVTVESRKLTLKSVSKYGEAVDEMPYLHGDDIKFHIDPTRVKRISPMTTKVALLPRVVVFTDDKHDFIHLIAHHSV